MSTTESLANQICRFVNIASDKQIHAFVRHIEEAHTVVQQRFTKICYLWLMKLAQQYENGTYDVHNKDAAEFGALVRNALIEKAGGDDYTF